MNVVVSSDVELISAVAASHIVTPLCPVVRVGDSRYPELWWMKQVGSMLSWTLGWMKQVGNMLSWTLGVYFKKSCLHSDS